MAVLEVVKQDGAPLKTDDAGTRALLRALGFDPDTHRIENVRGPHKGLRVIGPDGRPQKFFSTKKLTSLQQHWKFLVAYDKHLTEEGVTREAQP